jgi:hypothetical protein
MGGRPRRRDARTLDLIEAAARIILLERLRELT